MVAATSALTAIIADRVYPAHVKIADKVYPLIAYKIDNFTTSSTYDASANKLRSCHITVACIDTTYAGADRLAEAVLAIDGTDGTWGDTVIQGCFLNEDSISDDVVTEPETEAILYFIKELSFLVWYVA